MKSFTTRITLGSAALLAAVAAAPVKLTHFSVLRAPLSGHLATRQTVVQELGCDLSNVTLDLFPAARDAGLAIPAGEKLLYAALGRGVQNATCSGGVYTNGMAVAKLYDVSCDLSQAWISPNEISEATTFALQIPRDYSGLDDESRDQLKRFEVGDHYFQEADRPAFDARAYQKGDFFVGKKDAAVPDSVDASRNIPWVQLSNVEGALANHVFRAYTAGGVAPTSCSNEGQVGAWDYAAVYYFFK